MAFEQLQIHVILFFTHDVHPQVTLVSLLDLDSRIERKVNMKSVVIWAVIWVIHTKSIRSVFFFSD